MKRSTIFFWISLFVLFSLVAVPGAVLAQEGEVEAGEPGEGEIENEREGEVEVEPVEGEVEVEPVEGGEGEGGEGDEGEGEGGEGDEGEAAGMEGGEGEGEAPEYLPATGGATQATSAMVVLTVLGLLFAGAFLTRAFQRNA